jgi:NAD(P)-dependent dehydrogenase (short-subunit alcohol dehydrogenase family)
MKTYVITGATSGIGYATARLLAASGALVIGTGRSPERCAAKQEELRSLTGNPQIYYLSHDLALQSEVRALAAEIIALLGEKGITWLDGLVNNAGTFTYWLMLTQEGIETQWAVNHLAPWLLTNLLLPLLAAGDNGRVVTVSSESHYGARLDWNDPQHLRKYNGLRMYGETKLANILFTRELNQRLPEGSSVQAFAVDPGLVNTNIGEKGTPGLVQAFWKARRRGGTSPDLPAATILFLLLNFSVQTSDGIYWKNCATKKPSHYALDKAAALRLWEYSKTLCGIEEEL